MATEISAPVRRPDAGPDLMSITSASDTRTAEKVIKKIRLQQLCGSIVSNRGVCLDGGSAVV
jgi:hypothetical protein